MNEKAKNLFKSLNYTVTANFLVLGISVVLNLVVPKYLGIADYGYWQLYVFYSSYVGFFHFGWIDGIYLKIGGEEYENLDKENLGSQFYYLFIMQCIFALLLSLLAILFVPNGSRQLIWLATAAVLVIANIKSFILFILQSTNRIKEYAKLSRDDRYFYLIGAMGYLLLGGRNPLLLIGLDVLSKLLVTLWGLSRIKDIVTIKKKKFVVVVTEIKDNIRIGSNLMLGSIASMLILGVSRFFVEQRWDIETFGKLSFALSISNMFMLFIASISVVLYPLLRRTNPKNLPTLYIQVRNVFVPFTLLSLLFFSPIRFLLDWWLPEYSNSLFYMSILFPMIIYEGRISLLVNTYLKTIREEKVILRSNIITLVVSSILSLVSIFILNSMTVAVISIIFSLSFRCILSETLLSKVLDIRVVKQNIIEAILVIIFISGNLLFNPVWSFVIYLTFFCMYIYFSFGKIKKGWSYFISLSKDKK